MNLSTLARFLYQICIQTIHSICYINIINIASYSYLVRIYAKPTTEIRMLFL